MRGLARTWAPLLFSSISACGDAGGGTGAGSGSTTSTGGSSTGTATSSGTSTGAAPTTSGSEGATGTSTGGLKLDVGADTGPGDACKVVEDDGTAKCTDKAPPDSFEPAVQWEWSGQDGYRECTVTPLVANFTDDDGNGSIDLCDVPDVVIVADDASTTKGARMFLLDGATGALHFAFEGLVDRSPTPALGDIDGDGLVEVVTTLPATDDMITPIDPAIVAFEHDGSIKWTSTAKLGTAFVWATTTALADVDGDGAVEVAIGNLLLDAAGELLTTFPAAEITGDGYSIASPVPADLDGDGDLEILFGRAAYHHDGALYFVQPAVKSSGFSQVADLDGDGAPEVLVTTRDGITLLEADGSVVYADKRPTGAPAEHLNWARPAAIHDLDGDGGPEFLLSSKDQYSAFRPDASVMWSTPVLDASGAAAGSAFDFLGDSTAEAIYGDEGTMRVFDGVSGAVLLETPRSSWTAIEFPNVVDVDNDGSAEILVVSVDQAPTLRVIKDAQDRWIPARRIWNQHAYHVTNVREDGTIPAAQAPSWERLNTFRTQAQITAGGAACLPPPG